jgi:hypothetical protein
MNTFMKGLMLELNQAIDELSSNEPNFISFSKSAFELCEEKNKKLKEFLQSYQFENESEEIFFFKVSKPLLETRSIFYCQMFNIESRMSLFSDENKILQYKLELKKIMRFFTSKKEYYQYYKTQNSILDQFYFVRQKISIHGFAKFSSIDFNYSTGHDMFFNKIVAFEEMYKYIEQRIFDLEAPQKNGQKLFDSSLVWTANKVDLVELMYALFASRAINDGDIEINKIADFFQTVFNINLGDYYRTYSEMKLRSNKFKFLEKLIDTLENKMDNDSRFNMK